MVVSVEVILKIGEYILPLLRQQEDKTLQGSIILYKVIKDQAELKLFRSLKRIRKKFIVLHQLEFTHENYSAILPMHRCHNRRCKKCRGDHMCHKNSRELEGECDYLIIGVNSVTILKVKGVSFVNEKEDEKRLDGCIEKAKMQRYKVRRLVQSISSTVKISEYTVLPNINRNDIPAKYLEDDTLLFSEDLEHLETIEEKKVLCFLLGLWLIDQRGKWNFSSCKIAFCGRNADKVHENRIPGLTYKDPTEIL